MVANIVVFCNSLLLPLVADGQINSESAQNWAVAAAIVSFLGLMGRLCYAIWGKAQAALSVLYGEVVRPMAVAHISLMHKFEEGQEQQIELLQRLDQRIGSVYCVREPNANHAINPVSHTA
jgi:hypothetical protein